MAQRTNDPKRTPASRAGGRGAAQRGAAQRGAAQRSAAQRDAARRTTERELWLCLHLPRLGLELFTRGIEDGAADRPVVLVATHRVVQINAAGRARGLTPGMSLTTAESICADLAVAWRDEAREARALERLALWAWRFTPRVSPEPPADLLLEVAGSLRLFRGLDRLQRRILDGVAGLGWSALPAVAPTPLAARALAHAGRGPDVDALAPELVLEGRGDGALREAWSDAVARAARPRLARLPLEHLDRPEAELEHFRALGLRTLADLLRLPRAPLGRRLGRGLIDHLDRLTGRRADPRHTITPPETFVSEIHFLEDLEHQGALAFPMQRLVRELADWLRTRQQATDRLDWHLRHPRHGEAVMRVHFATPQADPDRLLEFSRLQLEREAGLAAVGTLELRVTRLTDPRRASAGLFPELGEDGRPGEDPALLVDRLRARLGTDVCRSVLPADDHRPERAWRSARPVPPRGRAGTTPGDDAAPAEAVRTDLPPGPRPLWLLPEPRPLAEDADGPCWHGPLTLCRGPERIEAGWWEDPTETAPGPARDYWVARHPQGAHLWLFRDLETGRWHLHGLFS
jgi:protein ImuB